MENGFMVYTTDELFVTEESLEKSNKSASTSCSFHTWVKKVIFLTYIRDRGPLYLSGLMPKLYLSWDTMTWMAAAVV